MFYLAILYDHFVLCDVVILILCVYDYTCLSLP
jgi:hypothetical protein